MREPTFWILTALAAEPRHGYGIIQDVARLSENAITLQVGTLYTAVDRLVAEGLVEQDHDEVVDGRNRRYYRITDHGAAALSEQTERLRMSIAASTARLAERKRFGLGPAMSQVAW